jgi:hypothetical protein
MNRSKPLRRSTGEARAELPILPQRKCANCKQPFRPFSSLVKWCSPVCGAVLGMKKLEKAQTKAAADDKRKTRAQLEALKTIPQLKKEAQREFNRYIRARDMASGVPCICCGRPLRWDVPGGAVDAGHYRSTGSADHLRFVEDNCHAQLSECNRFGAGRAVDYRIGLLDRIGQERVAALEASNTPIKWTREGLREIRDAYRAKARELERKQ